MKTFDDWVWAFDHARKERQVFTQDELKAAWMERCSPIACARQNDDLAKGYDAANR